MNIAFPAFLLFFLVLPGFLFRSAFRKAEAEDFDFRPFAHQTALAILIAGVLHTLWLFVWVPLTPYKFNFPVLLALLEGNKDQVIREPLGILLYFLSLMLFSYMSGALLRYLIRRQDWDIGEGWLAKLVRFDTPWYYLFTGMTQADREGLDGIFVAAIVVLKDAAYLYRGVLFDWHFTRDGKLDWLVLQGASRRQFGPDFDKQLTEQGVIEERFYVVEGNYFVLRYEEVHTLNIAYIKLPVEL